MLQKNCDFIVVGAGVIGLLLSRELAKAGASVRLFDKSNFASESSWSGGGILSPLYPWKYPAETNALLFWSQQYYPKLVQDLMNETGVDSELLSSGLLVLDEDQFHNAEYWAGKNISSFERVDSEALKKSEPSIAQKFSQAVLLPDIMQIRNPRFGQALKKSAKNNNKTFIHENQAVDEILNKQGQVFGVKVGHEKYHAKTVIMTAGAWTNQLIQSFAIDLAIKPIKGQMILYDIPAKLTDRIILYDDHYIIPRSDGKLLVGSTVEDVGFDKSVTALALKQLQQRASEILPDLANYSISEHWAGLRPGSVTNVPFIGKIPYAEGLYVNSGHFRNGFALAPASAVLLADILLARNPIMNPQPYQMSIEEKVMVI